MTITTHYLDCNGDELPDTRPPFWFRNANREPCSCTPVDAALELQHIGFSDSAYQLWRCRKCRTAWVTFVEG